MTTATGRVVFQASDVSGSDVRVELTVRLDTVELRGDDQCRAVFDREVLGGWLNFPEGVLTVDEVTWASAGERVGLTIDPVVPWHPLEPVVLGQLRRLV
jgi:hypothetical protein